MKLHDYLNNLNDEVKSIFIEICTNDQFSYFDSWEDKIYANFAGSDCDDWDNDHYIRIISGIKNNCNSKAVFQDGKFIEVEW